MEWQPIETAPKDQYPGGIIVLDESGFVTVAFYDEDDDCWWDSINHNGSEHAPRKPTHWHPWPEPPAQAAAQHQAPDAQNPENESERS